MRASASLIAPSLAALVACADPGSVELARGNGHAQEGRLTEALTSYRAAALAAPGTALPLALEGHLLADQGDLVAAEAAYRRALARDAKSSEARAGLAQLSLARGRAEEAVALLEPLRATQALEVWRVLAHAYLLRGEPADVQKALELSAQVLEQGRTASALYLRGHALLATRAYDQAQASLLEAEQLAPDSPLPPYGRARVAAARGEKSQALSQLAVARSRSRSPGQPWRPEQVAVDPAFAQWKDDPEFKRVVGP